MKQNNPSDLNIDLGSRTEQASLRIAQWVSRILNPVFIVVPLYLTVALVSASSTYEALLWWAIISLGIGIAPAVFIHRGVRQGRYTDHDISKRDQRLVPFLFTIGCMITVLVLLLTLHVSVIILATFTGMISSIVIALLITHLAHWKISLHLIGITGTIVTLGLFVSPFLYYLSPIILIVGWARWRVKAHTPLQAVAGAALAAVITVAVLRLFGL
ncbi:hypothetical protein [Cohnella silvisoli]|uniref:PAP2 family protein n=1 Tax=Cohnella silvisoli TaxID=2873699 RepID=A0ABV1L180_9BACL|nr:hypothetical protein [Cohnella silvisoli]MCD9025543.1 hypothetical protein [Cohnella silvisoli]